MNKTEIDRKIILYLDKQLSPEEELQFKEEILNSTVLMERFDDLNNNLLFFKSSINPETDERYFINVIPQFREKNYKRKGAFILPGYAAVLSGSAVLVVMVLFLLFFNRDNGNIQEFPDLNASEMQQADEEYSIMEDLSALPEETSEYLENTIDSLMTDEFISYEGAEYYLSSNDVNSILSDISSDEAEMIYDQIINKDILNGEL